MSCIKAAELVGDAADAFTAITDRRVPLDGFLVGRTTVAGTRAAAIVPKRPWRLRRSSLSAFRQAAVAGRARPAGRGAVVRPAAKEIAVKELVATTRDAASARGPDGANGVGELDDAADGAAFSTAASVRDG